VVARWASIVLVCSLVAGGGFALRPSGLVCFHNIFSAHLAFVCVLKMSGKVLNGGVVSAPGREGAIREITWCSSAPRAEPGLSGLLPKSGLFSELSLEQTGVQFFSKAELFSNSRLPGFFFDSRLFSRC